MKQHSIATKVTRSLSLLLIFMAALLFFGAYKSVYTFVINENKRYATSLLATYVDYLSAESERKETPIDMEHTEDVIRVGKYFCNWYDIDYTYIYFPDTQADIVTYIAVCYKGEPATEELEEYMIGDVVEYELTSEELAVWNGEALSAQYTIDNQYGHEIATVMRLEDAFGNRYIASMDTSFKGVHSKINRSFFVMALIILTITTGAYIYIKRTVQKMVSQPAQRLSKRMQDFITDGKRTNQKITVDDDVTEFSMIASAFNHMTDEIDNYVEDINTLTREQEHRQTELDIASNIQRGLLPAAGMTGSNFDIHGSMTPARDVGGDLFDYIVLNDTQVLVVIADVSGKGTPAAMFMTVTLTLIRQFAKMGLMPDEILRRTNDALTENNAAMLFVTAFVGIFDSQTGTLTYCNAGHNRPYIIGSRLRKLDDNAGLLLGMFEGEQYSLNTVPLNIGETLFLYTDGVTDAVNVEHKLFGTQRLEETLRRCFRENKADNPVIYVSDTVSAFAGAAEQHDDITMCTLSPKKAVELSLAADIREMNRIKAAILSLPLPRSLQLNLCLTAEECFVNICSYAFEGRDASKEQILFRISVSDQVRLRFEDAGIPYDPSKNVIKPEEYDIDAQTGGLGKLIVFNITDEVNYEYRDGKNVLTLTKNFEEEENEHQQT